LGIKIYTIFVKGVILNTCTSIKLNYLFTQKTRQETKLTKTESCINQTLNKTESRIKQTLNKTESCINQTLNKTESCINQTLNKTESCINQTLQSLVYTGFCFIQNLVYTGFIVHFILLNDNNWESRYIQYLSKV
jgi:predicted transcriptional regulator